MARYDDTHTHPCHYCGTETVCPDTYTFNYDGCPETWCEWFMGLGNSVICDDCEAEREARKDWDDETRQWVAPEPDVDEQTLWGV